MKKEKCEVICEVIDKRLVLKLKVNGSSFPIVAFYKQSEYYNNNLQKNFEDLVCMESIKSSLGNLITAYTGVNRLTAQNYEDIMRVYKPFIYGYKPGEVVVKKIKEAEMDNLLKF